jgi:hypothetical protein
MSAEAGENAMANERLENNTASAMITMSVASLRRSSSHHTPTRTLQLSEQEHSSNNSHNNNNISPLARVMGHVMMSSSDRPRSNQRTRTPMRHESPAHPDELRAVSPEPTAATVRRRRSNSSDAVSSPLAITSGRITIRPLTAGAAVGRTVLSTTMVRLTVGVGILVFFFLFYQLIIVHLTLMFFTLLFFLLSMVFGMFIFKKRNDPVLPANLASKVHRNARFVVGTMIILIVWPLKWPGTGMSRLPKF